MVSFQFFFIYTLCTCCSEVYDIHSWNTTIINHAANDHKIPLTIHYPSNTYKEYPVMLFHHGWNCYITNYNYIWQHLVPLGFIIVMQRDYTSRNETNQTKCAISMRFTLDYIKQCNFNQTSPLYQMVGQKSIAVGHSLGGGVIFLSSSSYYALGQTFEYSFDAAFALAPGISDVDDVLHVLKYIDIPIFILTASHDCINSANSTSIAYYESISNNDTCKFIGSIANGTHCGFMNASAERQAQCDTTDAAACGNNALHHHNIALQAQIDIVIEYLTMFMDVTMKKKLLDDESQMDFNVVIEQLQRDKADGVLAFYDFECIGTENENEHKRKHDNRTVFAVVVTMVIVIILVIVCVYVFVKRRKRMKLQPELNDYMLHE